MRREESVGAKTVEGAVRERLALAVTLERSRKPRAERMVAKREGGYVWTSVCAEAAAARMAAVRKMRRTLRVAPIVWLVIFSGAFCLTVE